MQQQEEIEKIKQEIEKVNIVSFDIFDTLLLRNVIHPTDIFEAVEKKYCVKMDTKIEFKKRRILAEQKARSVSLNEDVTYDEIYRQLEKMLPDSAQDLKAMELEVEEEFLVCNTKLLALYNFALEQGKKVFIISDMYLSKRTIEKWLKDKGYKGEHKVYISSDIMKSKVTGELYKYIEIQEKLDKRDRWLHIGSNYQADYINVKKADITGYYYKAIKERYNDYKCETLAESIIRAIQLNTMYLGGIQKDYWYNFGIEKVAPLYIGFMNWLEKELEGKDNVYFLARDGYMPFRLYQKLCEINDKLPKGKYLYASRRAYIYPNLPNMEREEALDILMAANKELGQSITIEEVLNNIGLDRIRYETELKKIGINKVDIWLNEDGIIKKFRSFLNEIWDDIEIILTEEQRILREYFEQEGLFKYKEINIVDIGWRGSTHKSLQNLLNKKVNGYYLGTIKQIYSDIRDRSKGYIFNEGKPKKNNDIIMQNVMVFEMLFSAPMGSVIRFERRGENIEPYFSSVEKNQYLYMAINNIQEAIEDVLKVVFKYRKYINFLNQINCLKGLVDFIDEKNVVDLEYFCKLNASIGLGDSKDLKKYVLSFDEGYFLENLKKVSIIAQYLLWKDAILIVSKEGEKFNLKAYREKKYLKMLLYDYLIIYRESKKIIKKIILKLKKIIKLIGDIKCV